MIRVNLDEAPTDVQQFIRELPIDREGVELELGGKVVCEVLPPHALSETERLLLINRGRELARRARTRNEGVPPAVIEREVREAVEEVRGRNGR